jgi:hypothetical protein
MFAFFILILKHFELLPKINLQLLMHLLLLLAHNFILVKQSASFVHNEITKYLDTILLSYRLALNQLSYLSDFHPHIIQFVR